MLWTGHVYINIITLYSHLYKNLSDWNKFQKKLTHMCWWFRKDQDSKQQKIWDHTPSNWSVSNDLFCFLDLSVAKCIWPAFVSTFLATISSPVTPRIYVWHLCLFSMSFSPMNSVIPLKEQYLCHTFVFPPPRSYVRISAQLIMNQLICLFLSYFTHTLSFLVIYQVLPVFLCGVLHNCPLLSPRPTLFNFNQSYHLIILRLLQLSANWTPSLKTLANAIHCIKHCLINLLKMVLCSHQILLENLHTSL